MLEQIPNFEERSAVEKSLHDREAVQNALLELNMTPSDLAAFMHSNRDGREFPVILRGVQRMLSGETRVSGEMNVIINILLRQHWRLKAQFSDLHWNVTERGVHWARVGEWVVNICPETKGRFVLFCRHGDRPEDYSPPFGRWLSSIDEAKNRALQCVEEGVNDLAEFRFNPKYRHSLT